MIRNAYANTNILPDEVLWRRKEAFSDGVSKQSRSWYQIIEEKIQSTIVDEYNQHVQIRGSYQDTIPTTPEQYYYRMLFEESYHMRGASKTIPYYWMPKYVDAKDASARTLSLY